MKNGEQKDSVGVYNIATPAAYVSGDGQHLTSQNDKVINSVRNGALAAKISQPLPANIVIPLTSSEAADPFGGHSFSEVYLANASAKIIFDVDNELKKLSVPEISGQVGTNQAGSSQEGCFTPPPKNISYYAQKTIFAVADPVATGVVIAGKNTVETGKITYSGALAAVQLVVNEAKNISANISHQGAALIGNLPYNSSQQKNEQVLTDNNSGDGQIQMEAKPSETPQENDSPQLALNTDDNANNDISMTSQEPSTSSDANTFDLNNVTENSTSAEPEVPELNVNNSGGGGGGGPPPPVGGSSLAPNQPSQDNSDSENNSNIDNSQTNATSSQNENSSSTPLNSSSTPDIPNSSSTPEISNTTSTDTTDTTGTNTTSTDATSSSSSNSGILISEILFNSSGGDQGKEFVELYNPSDNEVDLTGWSLKYKKENATSVVPLASFKSPLHPEDKTLIKAKSFILIGLNSYDPLNYSGKAADVLRTSILPNGETMDGQAERIELTLHDSSSSEVDNIFYDKNSILSEGQSLERKSFLESACISAQASSTSGEFLGNGCDTDTTADFEIRISPNPQNSDSLPEPRSAPVVNNFQTSYAFTPRFDFSWDLSADSEGSTSTNKYFIYDTTKPSSTLAIFESTSTATSSYSFSEVVNEVGMNYEFRFEVQDRDGLSGVATTTLLANSFLDKFSFYQGTSTNGNGYFFDMTTTSSRPFWDATNSGGYGGWRAVVFYLNKDAPKEGQLSTNNQMVPSDNSYVKISYEGCGGGSGSNSKIIFPLNDASCVPGPLSAGAYSFRKLEDSRLVVPLSSSTSDVSFSENDYITLAFYDFGGGGGGSQWFNLAAVDKTKYYFKDALQNQNAPTMPENFSVNYDNTRGKLNLSWSSSTDSDTLDYLIKYEINYSTSSVFSDSDWQSVSTLLSTSTIPVYPNSYKIGVRAVDDFNNASAPATAGWSFPNGFAQLPSQLIYEDIVGSTGNSQKFFVSGTASIKSVALWGELDGGNYCCGQSYIQIRKDNEGWMDSEIFGTSTAKTVDKNAAPGEIVYTFDTPVQLEASSSYWIVTFAGPSATTNGTRYYGGTSDPYADGYWSGRYAYDIYFRFIQ
ncbi:MAG TPA: lamin tail domain-containing protein [Candidatus Paceibacterota bacterium]|nr:lamin tail domain-containing protein [Candidatus Paceibacterota bacterium]